VRISLKAINDELERLGSHAVLAKGDGYFYFLGGEATDWLDRTVRVPTLHSLTLEQWIEPYRILRAKNRALLTGGLNEKQPAESAAGNQETKHPDGRGGGQTADRKRKYRRISAKKPELRTGTKRNPR
jgi:hypothetical protein